jgi:hypothetical protein
MSRIGSHVQELMETPCPCHYGLSKWECHYGQDQIVNDCPPESEVDHD